MSILLSSIHISKSCVCQGSVGDANPPGQDNYGQEEKTHGRAMAVHGQPGCYLDHSLLNDCSRIMRSSMGLLLSCCTVPRGRLFVDLLTHVTRRDGRPAIGLICTPLHKSLPTALLFYLACSSKFFSFHLMIPSRNLSPYRPSREYTSRSHL